MHRPLLLLAVGMTLLACARQVEARVRLNSIRTVVLREGPALPQNRSAWEPDVDLTLYQCMSDLECREGSYCHAPSRGPAHSHCKTCRRRGRRCRRDSMCCPGNQCSAAGVCVSDDSFLSQSFTDPGDLDSPTGLTRRGRKKEKSSTKGQVGELCVRSSDCSDALCCARHFWTRICKPVLGEGQVCTRQRRKGHQGLELFQRCSCGGGLSCRALRDPVGPPPTLPPPLLVRSKLAPLSRHSSPHTSALSAGSRSPSVRSRLHICQRS